MRTFEEWRFSFFRVLGLANLVILSNRRKNYKKTIKLFGELVFLLYLCGEIE